MEHAENALAMSGKKGFPAALGKRDIHRVSRFFIVAGLQQPAPVGEYHCGGPIVDHMHQWAPVFHCTQYRRIQVLVGEPRCAEPDVVGHDDQQLCAITAPGGIGNQCRKQGFVANQRHDSHIVNGKAGPGLACGNPIEEPAQLLAHPTAGTRERFQ